ARPCDRLSVAPTGESVRRRLYDPMAAGHVRALRVLVLAPSRTPRDVLAVTTHSPLVVEQPFLHIARAWTGGARSADFLVELDPRVDVRGVPVDLLPHPVEISERARVGSGRFAHPLAS